VSKDHRPPCGPLKQWHPKAQRGSPLPGTDLLTHLEAGILQSTNMLEPPVGRLVDIIEKACAIEGNYGCTTTGSNDNYTAGMKQPASRRQIYCTVVYTAGPRSLHPTPSAHEVLKLESESKTRRNDCGVLRTAHTTSYSTCSQPSD
jgi:hypothetical protein